MLVLTRRIGEEIVLPGLGVTITVLRRDRNQIRLGITAPKDVRIVRSEIRQPSQCQDPVPLVCDLISRAVDGHPVVHAPQPIH